MTGPAADWPWPGHEEAVAAASPGARSPEALAALAARCFRGADGEALLSYLRNLTLNRALGPLAGDGQLRHLEGQRQLVAHLCHLVDLGRHGPGPLDDQGDNR